MLHAEPPRRCSLRRSLTDTTTDTPPDDPSGARAAENGETWSGAGCHVIPSGVGDEVDEAGQDVPLEPREVTICRDRREDARRERYCDTENRRLQ